MKLLFCPLYEIDQNEVIKNSKRKPIFSLSNYCQKLMYGFYHNLGNNLSIISTRTIASYPNYKYIFNKEKNYNFEDIDCKEISFINLPLIKYISEYFQLYKNINQWCLKNSNDDLYIVSYGRRLSHAWAINQIKKKYPYITTCMIYGDLSGKLSTNTTGNENSFISKMMDNLLSYSIHESLKFDKQIFFTKYMSEAINNTKPFLVIEGVCDNKLLEENRNTKKHKNKKCIVTYTGIISKKYSLDKLVEAFKFLDSDKYELHLYGIGDYVEEIKKTNKKNIKYKGYLEFSKISDIQFASDILVNPRQNNEEYTKYSFPSKTMEYLVTGNPVICYKLDGIPDEYDEILNYVTNNDAQSLANKIEEVYSSLNKEVYRYKVYQFLQNKTQNKQIEKILNFLSRK